MDPYGVNIHLTDGTSFYGQNHEIPTSYSNSLDILSLSKPDPYSNPYASVGLSQNTEDVFASKLNGLATSDWTSLPSSPARVTHTQFEAYKTPDLYAGSDLHFASKEVPVSIGSATSAENFASYAPAHNFEAKNITSIVGSDLKIDMHIPASISLQSEYRPEVDSLKAVDDILRRAVLTPTNQTLGLGKTFDFSSDSNEANKPRDTLESLLYPKTVGSVNVLGDILTPNIGSNLNLDLHSQVPAQLQSEYKPDLTNLYSTNALDGGSIRNSQDFHGVGLTPTHQSLTGFGPSFELGEALKVKDTLDSILNPKTTGSVNNILGDILGPKVDSNLNLDYHSQVPAQLQSDYKTDIDSIIPSSLATSSYKTAEEILKSEGLADKAFLGLDTSSNLSFETGSNKPKEDYGMLLSPKNLTSLNQITDTKGLNQSSNTDKYGFSREDIYGLKTSMTLFDTVLNSKVPAPKATDNILTSDVQGKNLKAEKIELQPILTKFSDDGQYAYSPLADSRSHSLNYLSGFGEALSPIAKGLNIRANNNEQIIGGNASFNFLDSYRDKSYKSVTDMILQEKAIGSVTDALMKEKDINSILNEKVSVPVSEIVPAEKAISSQIDRLITSSAIDKLLYPNITNPSEIKSTLTVDQILASAPQTGLSNVLEQPIHSAIDLLLQGASAKSTVDEFLSGRSAYSAIDLSFNDKALNSIVNPIPAQSTSTVDQLLNQKPIHSAIDLLLKDAAAKSTVDELLSGKPSYSLIDVTSTVNPVPAQSTLTVEQILNQKPVTVKDPFDAVINEKIVSPLADLLAAHKAGSLNAVNLQESKPSFAIDQILNSKIGSIIDDALALKNLDVASVLSKDDDANARVATILNGNKAGSVIDIVMPDQPMNLSSNSLEPLNINKLIGTGSLNNIKITQALDSLLSQKNKSAPNDEKNSKSSSHKSSGDDVDIVILNPKSKFAPESKTQKNDQAPAVKAEEKPAIDAILNAKIINPVVDLLTQAATKVDTASLIVPSTISSSFEKNEVKEPKGKPLAPFKSLPGPLKNQFKGYSTTSEVNETEFNTLSKKHLKEEKKEKFGLSLPMLSLVAKYKALADKKKK